MENRTVSSIKGAGMDEQPDLRAVSGILERHGEDRGGLISILEEIQETYGYLPQEALRIVSERTGRSLVDIYGVATFYRFFSLTPKGRHLICTCMGTACHVRGSSRIVAELEAQLGIKAGETTEDKEFTLETVNCLGACALGPVVVVDGHYFSKVRTSQVRQILDQARQGFDAGDVGKDERIFPINVSCPHCRKSLKDETFKIDGYPGIVMQAVDGDACGRVRLSCLYGSYSVASEVEIAEGGEASFICPHCGDGLNSDSTCSTCSAAMVRLLVDGGGTVEFCSRRGCRNHLLDLA